MEGNHRGLSLNMIVKNEAPVIARWFASVRPIVDYRVIVDIGPIDRTQDAIRASMADLPREPHERPWRDFAHNRTEALEPARPHGEYLLIIDADDVPDWIGTINECRSRPIRAGYPVKSAGHGGVVQ